MATKRSIQQMTIADFERLFPHEDACCAYLVARRWPTGVRCPRCGHEEVHPVGTMDWRWQCYGCSPSGYRFSHLVGTIFENTNYPLRTWFRVVHMMLTSKKGVSALQVHRTIGTGSYRTAWYMCHRIRAGLQDKDFRKLMGIVEVDETYIGGKWKNRHGPHDKREGTKGKTTVIGAVERKGKVVARVLAKINQEIAEGFVPSAGPCSRGGRKRAIDPMSSGQGRGNAKPATFAGQVGPAATAGTEQRRWFRSYSQCQTAIFEAMSPDIGI